MVHRSQCYDNTQSAGMIPVRVSEGRHTRIRRYLTALRKRCGGFIQTSKNIAHGGIKSNGLLHTTT